MKFKYIIGCLLVGTVGVSTAFADQQTNSNTTPQFYGFLKLNTLYSTNATDSFKYTDMSAPTNAAPHDTDFNVSRSSFQAAQSRFGFNLFPAENVKGIFEFDLIDFSKASPTTQTVPRVRKAKIEYTLDEKTTLHFGQDWAMFATQDKPMTFNYVGLYFRNGNAGFMRQQMAITQKYTNWNWGASVGLAGNNGTTADNDLEKGKTPDVTVKASVKVNDLWTTGASAIVSKVRFSAQNTSRDVYGMSWFNVIRGKRYEMTSNFFIGQNMENISMLTLGQGNAHANSKEFGGFITQKFFLPESEKTYFLVGVGIDSVYKGPYLVNGTLNDGLDGIKRNTSGRLSIGHQVQKNLTFYAEYTSFYTKMGNGKAGHADVIDLGVVMPF